MTKLPNILLIDDSERIIIQLKIMLMEINPAIRVMVATTLEQAEKIICTNHIDVVVLDIQLPDGNGIKHLKWLKEKFPKTIVLMFSSHSDSFLRNLAKESGADGFFDKLMEFEQLEIYFKEILNKKA